MGNRRESDDSDEDLATVSKHLRKRDKARKVRQLKKALKYLQLEINKKNKKTKYRDSNKFIYPINRNPCREFITNDTKVDDQVNLHARQVGSVMEEARKAVLQQDWEGARVLLGILTSSNNIRKDIHFLLKGCWLVMMAHPKSNLTEVREFVKFLTGYVLDEDVNKFIRIIFALRQTPLLQGSSGRLLDSIKVTHDQEYAIL